MHETLKSVLNDSLKTGDRQSRDTRINEDQRSDKENYFSIKEDPYTGIVID